MSYAIALNKAWEELLGLSSSKELSVKFLADEYTIDCENRRALSLSCNAPTKDFIAILLLHYLTKKVQGLPVLTEEWLGFKELSGIEGYKAAFKRRSLEPIIRKYGRNPQELLSVLDRLPGKRVDQADIGIVLEAFEGVPVMILMWRPDEEFGPEANILFDRSITGIFCTEDIVVLAGIVANQL
ncbi:MAG: hypothetical protein AMJ95_04960 [Omnitrophica WOR_2 bacterium SM23_72]|nr:MAG: hypothetical protein AMJ95_04960 [Omnitrophica WOR_2 bacterium SM23_72]